MSQKMTLQPGWVYNLADYRQMFDLSEEDLKSTLFDYPAGIASFNAEMSQLGYKVCSGDPHYDKSLLEMQEFAEQSVVASLDYLKQHKDILKDSREEDLALIETLWRRNVAVFLEDYEVGKRAKRYQRVALPNFNFEDFSFDLALCSNHLFTRENAHNGAQRETVQALCRIAKEVRVFPLLDETGAIAQSLGSVMKVCQDLKYGVEVREVNYHQLKGGNAMLRIWATECVIE